MRVLEPVVTGFEVASIKGKRESRDQFDFMTISPRHGELSDNFEPECQKIMPNSWTPQMYMVNLGFASTLTRIRIS
jgi:hypothetical protein